MRLEIVHGRDPLGLAGEVQGFILAAELEGSLSSERDLVDR